MQTLIHGFIHFFLKPEVIQILFDGKETGTGKLSLVKKKQISAFQRLKRHNNLVKCFKKSLQPWTPHWVQPARSTNRLSWMEDIVSDWSWCHMWSDYNIITSLWKVCVKPLNRGAHVLLELCYCKKPFCGYTRSLSETPLVASRDPFSKSNALIELNFESHGGFNKCHSLWFQLLNQSSLHLDNSSKRELFLWFPQGPLPFLMRKRDVNLFLNGIER